jgi:hypothetical protein
VTIRKLTGLVEACRLVVEPDGAAFVLTAPMSDVEIHLKKVLERGAAANPA